MHSWNDASTQYWKEPKSNKIQHSNEVSEANDHTKPVEPTKGANETHSTTEVRGSVVTTSISKSTNAFTTTRSKSEINPMKLKTHQMKPHMLTHTMRLKPMKQRNQTGHMNPQRRATNHPYNSMPFLFGVTAASLSFWRIWFVCWFKHISSNYVPSRRWLETQHKFQLTFLPRFSKFIIDQQFLSRYNSFEHSDWGSAHNFDVVLAVLVIWVGQLSLEQFAMKSFWDSH